MSTTERRSTSLLYTGLAVFGLLCSLSSPAVALCGVGNQPGSTLLFPYFEVDLASSSGLTALISVNNESNAATLTRLVVWTDWAVPVLAFDIYLGARDVQTMNVRDLLDGILPSTGGGADLSGFSDCVAIPPTYPNPAITPLASQQVRAYVSGVSGPTDAQCAGEPHGDNVARGYITVDTVTRCHFIGVAGPGTNAAATPKSATYFTDTAVVNNSLWGDLFFVDPTENSAQGVEAISLLGDDSLFVGPNANTFYGRFHSFDGRDKRSPLPTTFTSRYLNGGVFDGGTDLIAFRDIRSATVAKINCAAHPVWFPLLADFVTVRDEDGALALTLDDTNKFGLATQRVPVASLAAGPIAPFGRIQVGFSSPTGTPAGAWMIPVMTASGRFSVDFNASPLYPTCGLVPTP